ncbi:MAG TPA: PQQ-binding-like beta-propeller repeat protein [Gemmataceae bacterium]
MERRSALAVLVLSMLAAGAAPRDRHGDPLPDGATARLGTIRQRVAASQLAFSADGRTLITVAVGGVIARWDAATGQMREHRVLAENPANQFWLSDGGRLLAVSEDGKSLAGFDTETGIRKHRLTVPASHVAFRADGKMLATSEHEKARGCIRLWDLASGKDRLLTELPSYVNDFVFSSDGKRLFAAVDRSLRCWDVENNKEIWHNDHRAGHLAVSPDGRTLCSDTYQRPELHLWDAGTGRRIGGGEMKKGDSAGPLAFAADGRTVFLTNYKDVLLWDVAAVKVRRRLADAGFCFAVASDGKTLATIRGSLLRCWNVESGRPLYPDTSDHGHTAAVRDVVFTPDGRGVVTAADDGTIRSWRLSNQRPRIVRTGAPDSFGFLVSGTSSRIIMVVGGTPTFAVTADSRRLLIPDERGQLLLLDLQTGKEVRRFDVSTAAAPPLTNPLAGSKVVAGAARLSADGRTLWALTHHPQEITGGYVWLAEQQESLIGWDVATGRRLSTQLVQCGLFADNLIAPDGRSVALADGSVRDVADGRIRLQKTEETSWIVGRLRAFSADSRLLARAEGQAITIHELLTGRLLQRLEVPIDLSSHLVFSPDGRLLIAAGRDALHIWEVSTGRRLLHLPAEGRLPTPALGAFATCLAVAPGGHSAATGHKDGTVLLWDLAPAWRRLAERPTVALTDAQLNACWADLLRSEPRTAYAAMDRLAAHPTRAIALLRQRLRPATIDPQWLKERVAALDSNDFAVREKATHELEDVVEAIGPQLRRALEQKPTLEVRKRLLALLEQAPAPVSPRQLRAVAVLERIATEKARALLRELAKGESDNPLTHAAKEALVRIAARPREQAEDGKP